MEQESWPEYKTCKFTTESIVTEGGEKGESGESAPIPNVQFTMHADQNQSPMPRSGQNRRCAARGSHSPGHGLARPQRHRRC
jgi:hypothetical protein